MSTKRVFLGATQEEANRRADEWWGGQKGLRLIQRTQVAVGDNDNNGPALSSLNHWAVTIHFEGESSNQDTTNLQACWQFNVGRHRPRVGRRVAQSANLGGGTIEGVRPQRPASAQICALGNRNRACV
jgi:hypothetical protein